MNYKFIDLFAGIGGFRQGFESQGFECVFSSEINKHAQEVYYNNFGEKPFGDITQIKHSDISSYDILLAGFPCQSFSIAGKMGGFNEAKGTLFFEILHFLKYHSPKVVILENVKHFKNHDNGNTLRVVLKTLKDLGYTTNYAVLNAKDFGVPQNRERIIIVGVVGNEKFNFSTLGKNNSSKIIDILEDKNDFTYFNQSEYTLIENPKTQPSGLIFVGYLNKKVRKGVLECKKHLSRVHKQPYRIYSAKGIHPVLLSQETAGRYLIHNEGLVRKLTLTECYRLMGFPDDFKKVGTKSNLYNRIGNSIVIPMVAEIAKEIKKQYFSDKQL